LRLPLTFIAALVAVLLMSNLGWADSCSTITLGKQPITCTIPEQTPELALNVTLTGLSFTAQAQGMVLIYDDSSHTLLSDVVTFSNIGGVATVAFVSDTNGIPITSQGLPILGQFTESSKLITISLALGNGQVLHAKICSDWGSTSCYEGSDSITLSVSSVPEPGTIILDQDLSLVAATEQAWRWVEILGIPGPNDAEPLPGTVYAVATHVAASPQRPQRPVRVRLRTAGGRWMVIRAAPLATGSRVPAGYAVTLEAAPAGDLAPLLMRAWGLTRREREVARLVIDGLSTEDMSAALFISVNTIRDHLKAIFGKVGVTRRQDLAAALTTGTSTLPR